MCSQNNENEIIRTYFKGIETGVLLDIGANDGAYYSNTRELLLNGWNGCMIEPSPAAHDKLKSLYNEHSGVYTFNFAIGNDNYEGVLHNCGSIYNNNDVSLLATINKSTLERWKEKEIEFTEEKVPVRTFETFLACSPYKKFDFINIDAEGMDLDILKQINLINIGCKLIVVEYISSNISEIKAILEKQNMKFYSQTPENLIYVRS